MPQPGAAASLEATVSAVASLLLSRELVATLSPIKSRDSKQRSSYRLVHTGGALQLAFTMHGDRSEPDTYEYFTRMRNALSGLQKVGMPYRFAEPVPTAELPGYSVSLFAVQDERVLKIETGTVFLEGALPEYVWKAFPVQQIIHCTSAVDTELLDFCARVPADKSSIRSPLFCLRDRRNIRYYSKIIPETKEIAMVIQKTENEIEHETNSALNVEVSLGTLALSAAGFFALRAGTKIVLDTEFPLRGFLTIGGGKLAAFDLSLEADQAVLTITAMNSETVLVEEGVNTINCID